MAIVVRSADIKDSNWIVDLLKEGARDGHFGPTVEQQAAGMLQGIFENSGITMVKLREGIQAPVFVEANISIAEIDGDPASFLISLQEGGEVEVHLAATCKKYRRKRAFEELLDNEISKNSVVEKLYARCYKKSSWAIDCFKKANFEITKDGNPIELTFRK